MTWLPIAVGAGAGALVTVFFGWLAALRAQYERVLTVVDFISSAAVAEARHELGLIINSKTVPTLDRATREDRVRDLFTVLWAFGIGGRSCCGPTARTDYSDRARDPGSPTGARISAGPRRFLT